MKPVPDVGANHGSHDTNLLAVNISKQSNMWGDARCRVLLLVPRAFPKLPGKRQAPRQQKHRRTLSGHSPSTPEFTRTPQRSDPNSEHSVTCLLSLKPGGIPPPFSIPTPPDRDQTGNNTGDGLVSVWSSVWSSVRSPVESAYGMWGGERDPAT